jgi:hypothetical protein
MQIAHCPIIVAAHSLGGLIVKEVGGLFPLFRALMSMLQGLALAVSAKLKLSPFSPITGNCDPLRDSTFTGCRPLEDVCQCPSHWKRNTAEETYVY